ncbi:MAG: hypothetical protein WAW22_08340, partial [Smithellaceae bacterium]
WQPMQDVLTPMKNAGKLYKLILKLEKGQTNTAYVNLFNGLHIQDKALSRLPGKYPSADR